MEDVFTQPAPLCETLERVLLRFRTIFLQGRVFQRAYDLVYGTALTFSRKTMTQIRTALGRTQDDWSADYRLLSRGRFDSKAAATVMLNLTLEHVPECQPYCAVIDATHVSRSSLSMPGTGWTRGQRTARWSAGLQRAQRFENLCWLTPVENGYCRAIPLMWLHSPTPKAAKSLDEPLIEWEAGLTGIVWLRAGLDAAGRANQLLFTVADGSYDTNGIWKGLPARTVLMTRCAKNRKLRLLPGAVQPGQLGARRKYGARVATPSEMRKERQGWERVLLNVRGRVVKMICRACGPYLVEGAPDQPVFLILVRGYHKHGAKKRTRREPCQYLVNAVETPNGWSLPLPLADLTGAAWRRWEVEVCHREVKTGFGLGQMQCWSKAASTDSVEFMAWAYSSIMMAGYKTWNGVLAKQCRSLPRWRRPMGRWSVTAVLQTIRDELWVLGDFKPVYPALLGKPPKSVGLSPSLANAALGSARG